MKRGRFARANCIQGKANLGALKQYTKQFVAVPVPVPPPRTPLAVQRASELCPPLPTPDPRIFHCSQAVAFFSGVMTAVFSWYRSD